MSHEFVDFSPAPDEIPAERLGANAEQEISLQCLTFADLYIFFRSRQIDVTPQSFWEKLQRINNSAHVDPNKPLIITADEPLYAPDKVAIIPTYRYLKHPELYERKVRTNLAVHNCEQLVLDNLHQVLELDEANIEFGLMTKFKNVLAEVMAEFYQDPAQAESEE